jgi:CheB methylesterase
VRGTVVKTSPSVVVVVAASSGSVGALRRIVAELPPCFPAAVVIATDGWRTNPSSLAAILAADGPLPVTVARDQEALEPGRIVIAPADCHPRFEPGPKLRFTKHPTKLALRRSLDVLFDSAARLLGPHAVGIVLSGRSDDGAAGLAAIRAARRLHTRLAPARGETAEPRFRKVPPSRTVEDRPGRFLRSSLTRLEISRALLDQTRAAVEQTRNRSLATSRILRSWPRGGSPDHESMTLH